MPRQARICAYCGSPSLEWDAICRWDVETQAFALSGGSPLENCSPVCATCGEEVSEPIVVLLKEFPNE